MMFEPFIKNTYSSHSTTPFPACRQQHVGESEYFELEFDPYTTSEDETDYCLSRVRESMKKIVNDLSELGYDASIEALQSAVTSIVKPKPKPRLQRVSAAETEPTTHEGQYYERLMRDLSQECQAPIDDPIYEEISDMSDFDYVCHSDTMKQSPKPPMLPPRRYSRSASVDGLSRNKHISRSDSTISLPADISSSARWNCRRNAISWRSVKSLPRPTQ